MANRGNDCAPCSEEGVEHPISLVRKRQHQSLNQFNRKLARMLGLLDMVALYIRNHPQIARILTKRITRILTRFRPFEILFPGVFLGYADGIKVENILVGLREPDDCLVAAGKPAAAMQAVLEVPDDPIAKFLSPRREKRG